MAQPDLKQSQDVLKRSISTLRVLDDELGNLDDLKAERAREERNLEVWRHNVKAMKSEFEEVTGQYNAMAKKAHEAADEWQRLDREIKTRTAELNSINQQMQKIRERFQ
jgi:chromosome segregation ATPase